ncbi:hypothetical protein AB0D12_39870 [Streptomyces sp. NPDC048479]|uniref:hypothetical protein n=1 Tax=Streptomyces sp. NPDC048479 TaxID=3154725 RepID=UPI003438899A
MGRITVIASVLTATALMTAVSMTPASADSIADYDSYIRNSWQDGWGGVYPYPLGAPQGVAGASVNDFCNRNGFGGGCQLVSFDEESRQVDVDYRRTVSTAPYTNCNEKQVETPSIAYTKTNTATTTVGVSIAVAHSIEIHAGLPVFGGSSSWTFTITASTSYAWGESTSQADTWPVTVNPGYQGWLDWATYHGTAHGIATVVLTGPHPEFNILHGGTYKIVTDIKGDLPEPAVGSPAWYAQPNGSTFLSNFRRLSNAELSRLCPSWQKDSAGNLQEWKGSGPTNGYWVTRSDSGDATPVDFVI